MDSNETLDILYVCTECLPFAAQGSMAEMSNSLPKFCKREENVDIRVVMPYYSSIPEEYKAEFRLVGERTINLNWRNEYCGVYEFEYQGITYYFIDNKQYFDREKMYGYDDDVERFSFFSKATLDILPIISFFPDVIHANDWQTGMVCTFLKILPWQNPKYEHIKTVLTLHNLTFQGKADFGVVKDLLGVEDRFAYLFDFFGSANILKASILCSDQIVTISDSYLEEILTTDKGNGLSSTLESVKHKLQAIPCGIDYEKYDPASDEIIYSPFGEDSLESRDINKLEFQKELGLEENAETPIYAFIGHMTNQKGIDLLSTILEPQIEGGIEFVALGYGEPQFEEFFRALEQKHPQRAKFIAKYDIALARKIYASADFLFNLSSTEPCGLSPMIANRYGAMPIVYLTGAIKDNFSDFKYTNGNGYILKDFDANSLFDLFSRTLRNFADKEKIESYKLSGMRQVFDAKDCAEKYLTLYDNLAENKMGYKKSN